MSKKKSLRNFDNFMYFYIYTGVLKTLTRYRTEFGSRHKMWLVFNPYVIISNGKDIEVGGLNNFDFF